MDILFANQQVWHSAETTDPKGALVGLAAKVGFTSDQVDTCLKDQAALDKMKKGVEEANTVLKVNATPSNFFNGDLIEGAAPFEKIEAKIKEKLGQ